jgi:hypothetical protein
MFPEEAKLHIQPGRRFLDQGIIPLQDRMKKIYESILKLIELRDFVDFPISSLHCMILVQNLGDPRFFFNDFPRFGIAVVKQRVTLMLSFHLLINPWPSATSFPLDGPNKLQ